MYSPSLSERKTNTKTELEPTGTFEHNHGYSYPRYRNM